MFDRNNRNNRNNNYRNNNNNYRNNNSNYGNNNNSYSNAPVNVGETYDVKIEDIGRSGDGIAKVDGYILFVPNTKKDQEVKIKVTATKRNLGFAELVE
ncbi:putative RNA-binding protein [Methanobrevibacter arboriphilus JCM 13429 = DSM 1125]|uniref:Putative RNA-binding protein n=1 Tax=Methanobrevibacter arboriphilus JCM 13429 = DSM 1125 TaxID=1300164 RepID=A0A1V6N576_METAZ|nr:TRAM domain-containing protein [Methanobrevibacter arboriphilus]OQD59878.1 putative RNA-binding protein [Methanobrevibacter arboriphilus JCM 13429 = DSM 1125]